MIESRYEKNIDDIFTEKIQLLLLSKNISVIGCGGQGSYILEFLTRLGVNSITFWGGDVYELKNLNRQLGCDENSIGKNKADTLYSYLSHINKNIILHKCNWYLDHEEDLNLLLKSDCIFYCADQYYNVEQLRKQLRYALEKGIPIIDCPVYKLGGQIFIDTNEDMTHYDFFTNQLIFDSKQDRYPCSQPAYKCALMAAEAVNQMVQYFSNIRYASKNSQLIIDMYHHKYIERDKYTIQ